MALKFPKPSNKGKTSAEMPLSENGKQPSIEKVDLLVDKIAITANLSPAGFKATLAAFADPKNHKLLKPAEKLSPSYETVHLIALGERTAHVCFFPKKTHFPDFRIEFNPAKAGASGMKALRDALDRLLPFGGWDFLMEYGRVSRLDVAADISGARMYHFHALPNQVLTTKTFENQAKLKTINIGKPKGNQLSIYSKSALMALRGKPLPGPVVRIEKRLKKNLNLDLSQIGGLSNPLLGFKVVSTPNAPPLGEDTDKKRFVWTLFLDSVARRTLGPALKVLPQGKMTIYRKHFEQHEQIWWDAEQVWSHWPETLLKMRLVPTGEWPD